MGIDWRYSYYAQQYTNLFNYSSHNKGILNTSYNLEFSRLFPSYIIYWHKSFYKIFFERQALIFLVIRCRYGNN